MRLLFINSRKSDYLEDQLFSGLTELLGSENVIPFPVNSHYYFSLKSYPRNMGLSRGALNYLPDRFTNRAALKAMAFDAVIIGSTKRDTFEHFLQIASLIPATLPLIYIDGGDWPEIGGDARRMNFEGLFQQAFRQRQPQLIFKRECLLGKEYPGNVIPLPMAFKPQPDFIPAAKRYEVTLWCVESDPIRTQALQLLQGRYDCTANGSVPGQQFRSYQRKGLNYLRELSASKIACNFRGVGWDTMRYWEIPGVNTFMVTQRPGIIIPDNFVDGEHVVYCKDDLSDFLQLLDYYLQHETEREEIAANGHRHLLQHHTHRQRADYFLSVVQERLGLVH
ncbi:MAG TPA: glycosyltransferase [Gammaproteobacteria bacterium]